MSTNKGNKMNVKIIGIGGGGINVIDCFQKMDGIPREYILMDSF